MLTHKVQVLLSDDQYRLLVRVAKAQRKGLSTLLREEAVEQMLKKARRAAKKRALEEIAAMDLPVADWPELEAQIERARAADWKQR